MHCFHCPHVPCGIVRGRPTFAFKPTQLKSFHSSGVYPIINRIYFTPLATTLGGLNLGGINETGQVPVMAGNFALIDKDTPQSAYTKSSFQADGTDLQLVFSDEFNVDGRTFYPGDDPYWEAEDMHYWSV